MMICGNLSKKIIRISNNPSVQWPTIENVIPKSDWIPLSNPNANCFTLAKQQLAKKSYQISTYYAPGQTFQIYTEAGGANSTMALVGVGYLFHALENGIPVIVGIDNRPGDPGNPDQSTDHFVVIVGAGSDSKGYFFRFYNNSTDWISKGAHDENKLYFDPITGKLLGKSQTAYANQPDKHDYIVTQIRKSNRFKKCINMKKTVLFLCDCSFS